MYTETAYSFPSVCSSRLATIMIVFFEKKQGRSNSVLSPSVGFQKPVILEAQTNRIGPEIDLIDDFTHSISLK
jgi:hypothetical protein